MYIHTYIHIHTHTHTHTDAEAPYLVMRCLRYPLISLYCTFSSFQCGLSCRWQKGTFLVHAAVPSFMLSEFVKFISKSSCDEKLLRSHQVIVFRSSVVVPLLIPAVTSCNLQVLAFRSKQAVSILRLGSLFAYRMQSARI
jgi:hypothetical protein